MNITLTHDEIRQSSTVKLRKILKEDIDVELDDMINYELYIREFSWKLNQTKLDILLL